MNKKCSKCQQSKPKSEFYKRAASKDGLRARCKPCSKQPKHSQNQPCPQCGEPCWSKGGVCKSCQKTNAYDSYSKLTIGDKIYDKHKYAKYQYVRYWARRIAIDMGWNKCSKCGYDKHFEVAHIEPISKFPPETLLTVVNDPSNLMALCPNCHWEFDNLK
jgi:hypothetical protein